MSCSVFREKINDIENNRVVFVIDFQVHAFTTSLKSFAIGGLTLGLGFDFL